MSDKKEVKCLDVNEIFDFSDPKNKEKISITVVNFKKISLSREFDGRTFRVDYKINEIAIENQDLSVQVIKMEDIK